MPSLLKPITPPDRPSIPDLALEAEAVPLLRERRIGFTWYPRMHLLLVTTDRMLTPEEHAALNNLLEHHQGLPPDV